MSRWFSVRATVAAWPAWMRRHGTLFLWTVLTVTSRKLPSSNGPRCNLSPSLMDPRLMWPPRTLSTPGTVNCVSILNVNFVCLNKIINYNKKWIANKKQFYRRPLNWLVLTWNSVWSWDNFSLSVTFFMEGRTFRNRVNRSIFFPVTLDIVNMGVILQYNRSY